MRGNYEGNTHTPRATMHRGSARQCSVHVDMPPNAVELATTLREWEKEIGKRDQQREKDGSTRDIE